MDNVLRRAATIKFAISGDFWRQILSSERIAGTTFQHLRVVLTDQATTSRHISKTVSCLGENSSSRPPPVFLEFKYTVIYSKMFFQQEITDAEVGTSYADC